MSALKNKLGIIIGNYNKGRETLECIQSVMHSDGFALEGAAPNAFVSEEFTSEEVPSDNSDYFQIYVVDSASVDNSVQLLSEAAKENSKLTLILSQEDSGSCGGLNIGIQQALTEGCDYLCCLGEDVTVEKHALTNMLMFLRSNPNVGMVGGMVYHKHMPHYIQQYGISVDFKHFRAATLYADTYDDGTFPNEVYCDAIGACGVMVSAEAIQTVGLIPEDNFLYWDDTEWGYCFRQAGYEVVAIAAAKLYHAASPMRRYDNTKANYYLTRNCLNFFMKYTKPESCAKMSIVLLRSIYESFYLHHMGHAHNMAQSDITALLDAIYGIRGKAAANRILANDENGLGFVSFFEEQEAVYMEDDDPFLEQVIRQINPNIVFMQIPKAGVVTIVRCKSILGIKDFHFSIDFSEDVIYIDKSYRMLATREDAKQVKDYESGLQLFLSAMQPAVLRRITEIRDM